MISIYVVKISTFVNMNKKYPFSFGQYLWPIQNFKILTNHICYLNLFIVFAQPGVTRGRQTYIVHPCKRCYRALEMVFFL